MSALSVTSSKREQSIQDLQSELEALRALNSVLKSYLERLRTYRHNLNDLNRNCKLMDNVNEKWIEAVSIYKS